MWVPAAILILALLLQVRPLRNLVNSESAAAFALASGAVLLLYQMDRLA